ncbi:MAG: hypothetical protein ACOVOR_05005 [Rhabdochlamydiaceae bacterium]
MSTLMTDLQNCFEVRYAISNIDHIMQQPLREEFNPTGTAFTSKSIQKITGLVLELFTLIVFHQTMNGSTNPMNLAGKVINFSRFLILPCYKITDIFMFGLKILVISVPLGMIASGIVERAHTTENALTRQNRKFNLKNSELHPNSLLTIEILFKTISLILIYQMRPHIGPSLTTRLIFSTTLPFIISKFIDPERKKDSFLDNAFMIYSLGLRVTSCYFTFIPLFR